MFLFGGASNGRGPSPVVWGKIPREVRSHEDPSRGFGLFDDFLTGPASQSAGQVYPGWVATVLGGNGTIRCGDDEGGILILAPHTSSQEDTGVQMQTNEFLNVDADSRIAFGFRIKLVDADQTDVLAGIATQDTDLLGSLPADICAFQIADASANILYMSYTTGSPAGSDSGEDAADDTWVRLEAYIDGETNVKFYVDGSLVATSTTLATDTPMGLTLSLLSGEDANNYLYLDWAYAYQWWK